MYIFNNTNTDNHIYKLNLQDDSIDTIPDVTIPFSTAHIECVALNNDIYLIGGAQYPQDQSNYKFDTTNNTFTQMTNLPERLLTSEYITCTDGMYIYIYYSTTKVYKYDPITNNYETLVINLANNAFSASPKAAFYKNNQIYLILSNKKVCIHNIENNSFEEIEQEAPQAPSFSSIGAFNLVNNIAYISGASSTALLNTYTFPVKSFEEDTIIISQNANLYKTKLFNLKTIQGNLNINFDNIYIYKKDSSDFDLTTEKYYGNGSSYIKIN